VRRSTPLVAGSRTRIAHAWRNDADRLAMLASLPPRAGPPPTPIGSGIVLVAAVLLGVPAAAWTFSGKSDSSCLPSPAFRFKDRAHCRRRAKADRDPSRTDGPRRVPRGGRHREAQNRPRPGFVLYFGRQRERSLWGTLADTRVAGAIGRSSPSTSTMRGGFLRQRSEGTPGNESEALVAERRGSS